MQTFMTDRDWSTVASTLDSVRLNKQLVECQQILAVLHGKRQGYKNHPAVKMWAGYEKALATYAKCMGQEIWYRTGKTHKSLKKIKEYDFSNSCRDEPKWVTMEEIIVTHRSRLVQKGKVDRLRTEFFRKKGSWAKFLEENTLLANTTKFYQLTPIQIDQLEGMLKPKGVNYYEKLWLDVPGNLVYIWSNSESTEFKFKGANGQWRIWKPGDQLPRAD